MLSLFSPHFGTCQLVVILSGAFALFIGHALLYPYLCGRVLN